MAETQNEKTNMSNNLSKMNPFKTTNLKVNFKAVIAVFGVLLLAFILYFIKGFFVAAVVNNKPISRLTVISELEKQGGKQVLETLITKQLINDEIKKKGVKVTDAEVDAEIKNIENSLVAQGTTLDQALAAQNLSRAKLNEEIKFNKEVEKLVAEKVAVTDAEVTQYFNENKTSFPKDAKIETYKTQIAETLKQQKLSTEVQKLIEELKTNAKVSYWMRYN